MRAFWDRLRQDIRYGWRMMLAKPGITLVAALSIALGIGATTAIYSVVYGVLIDPYPYRAADRIGWLGAQTEKSGRWHFLYSPAQYREIKNGLRSMEDAVAVQQRQAILTGKNILPEVVNQEYCSRNMFEFFGVPPLFGREFLPRDFPGAGHPEPVAVISYKFWQHAFQGNRDVIGRDIVLDNTEYTIIGVLPIRFTWNGADAYTPLNPRPGPQEFVEVFYRARAGVTAQQVTAEFEPLIREFQKQAPRFFYPRERFRLQWVTVNEGILGKFSTTLLALFGAVLLLLLIACGNVANLLLGRAATRGGEMAIRVSIGATRTRLMAQMLTESVLLAVGGGVIGILLAFLGVKAVIALMPEYSIPHEAVIALQWPVLWFAAGLSILTGLVFGLVPALQVSAGTHAETLKGTGRGGGASAKNRRFHDSLMVFEITLALVLLTGAALAVKGFVTLQQKTLGFDPKNVLTFEVPLGEGNYTRFGARLNFFEAIVSRLRALPGVEAAAISEDGTPPWNGMQTRMTLDDRPANEPVIAQFNIVGDEYFPTVRQALLRGRLLTQEDVLRASPVAVVTQDFVRQYFNDKDAIGRHVSVDLFDQPLPTVILKAPNLRNSFEVVGVVGSARNRGLDREAAPAVFVPYSVIVSPGIWVLARTPVDPMALANQARRRGKGHRSTAGDYARAPAGVLAPVCDRLPAVRCVSVRGIRRCGNDAGGSRSFQRRLLRSGASHPRVRHSHGVGRPTGRRAAIGVDDNRPDSGSRIGSWARPQCVSRTRAGRANGRHGNGKRAVVLRSATGDHRGDIARLLCAGARRYARAADGCLAARIVERVLAGVSGYRGARPEFGR